MSELRLNTDGHIIKFGADNDVSLTHVADTGLLLNSTRKLQFNDASQFVQGTSATVLSIGATDEIDLTATEVEINVTTLDVNGAVVLNGAVTGATNITLSGELDAATGDFSGVVDVAGATTVAALTASGLITANADMLIGGTTPTLTIGDAGAEDAKIVFDGNAQDYHIGLDDTDDSLKIGLGSALGTTAHIVMDATGAVTKPLQPSFLVSAETQSNVTGDNTDYNLLFTNEIVDRNADYGSSLFTAPVTGLYQLSASLFLTGIAANHTSVFVSIVTSNRRQNIVGVDGGATDPADSGELYLNGSALFDMDANDTAKIAIDVRGGSKVVDIAGGTDSATFFSGALIA